MSDNPNKIPENRHTDVRFSHLSDAQWRFITAMVENPSFSKKEAAEYIGITPDTVYKWGADLINSALEEARHSAHNASVAMRQQALLKAMRVKIALLDSDDESIRSKAASEIIEWELGKATQRNEHTGRDGNELRLNISFADLLGNDDD